MYSLSPLDESAAAAAKEIKLLLLRLMLEAEMALLALSTFLNLALDFLFST